MRKDKPTLLDRIPGVLLLAPLVLGIWVAWPFLFVLIADVVPKRASDLGQLGDIFGALSSLFSALALIGAATGVVLQARSLEKQREQFASQQAQIERQNFESSFFELLRLQREVVQAMSVSTTRDPALQRPPAKGVDAIEYLATRFLSLSNVRVVPSDEADPDQIAASYAAVYAGASDALDRYFRNLFHVFKFIDTSAPASRRLDYASLARAQLTTSELVLISGNMLHPIGDGTRKYGIEFALLKALLHDRTLTPSSSHEALLLRHAQALVTLFERRGLQRALRRQLNEANFVA